MSTNEYHVEEYKQLMEDRISRVKEIRTMEVLAIGGVSAIYAWLASINNVPPILWYLPVLIPVFAFYRALMMRNSIAILNEYIRRLEDQFNKSKPELEGFESWRAKRQPSGVTRSTYIFWIALIVITLLVPTAILWDF